MRRSECLDTHLVDGNSIKGWCVASNDLQRVAASMKIADIDAEVLEGVVGRGNVGRLDHMVHTVDLEVHGFIGGGHIAVNALIRQIERQHTVRARVGTGGDRRQVAGNVENPV